MALSNSRLISRIPAVFLATLTHLMIFGQNFVVYMILNMQRSPMVRSRNSNSTLSRSCKSFLGHLSFLESLGHQVHPWPEKYSKRLCHLQPSSETMSNNGRGGCPNANERHHHHYKKKIGRERKRMIIKRSTPTSTTS